MTFQNLTDFRHDAPEALGVLLVNLGTPDAPTVAAVRRYLAEFLSDPRVIEVPRPLWWLILHGVILRIRPARSAHAYQAVWTDRGSPLLDISRRLADALARRLGQTLPGPVQVELGMRYGNPSIPDALGRLRNANCRRLLVLPLYPQYSATTTASTFDAVTRELSSWRWVPELRTINQYHDVPGHIEALAQSVRDHWAAHGRPDRLLFSFHGIPKDYFLAGDPYQCQCQKTARLVAEALDLPREDWALSFQSRVGTKEWLRPYTDETLKAWGAQGVGSVQVICPGFAADCLETLEEIAVENRGYFLGAGGREYGYIPALNDTPAQVQVLADLVRRHAPGWPEAEAVSDPAEGTRRLDRAKAAGAQA
jgi:protoporphyrin/coproporphyrin ferrochelatase